MQVDLRGRVAAVTGGGQGIGAAIAEALTDAGARVAVTDIDEDQVRPWPPVWPELPRGAWTWPTGMGRFRCGRHRGSHG